MVLEGRVFKDKSLWLSEIPALDAMTQGRSKKEAIEMVADWIRSIINDPNLEVSVIERQGLLFVELPVTAPVIALLLQKNRERQGLSVREMAERLGFKSHNAYAQYERGKVEPSLSQLERFLNETERPFKIKVG